MYSRFIYENSIQNFTRITNHVCKSLAIFVNILEIIYSFYKNYLKNIPLQNSLKELITYESKRKVLLVLVASH